MSDVTQYKSSDKNKKLKFSFKLSWLWYGLLIIESVAILVVLVLLAMGRLAMTPKDSNENVARIANVCTSNDIAEANKYITTISVDNISKFKNFVANIEKRNNYKNDFSCLNIITAYAMQSNDLDRLKSVKTDMNKIVQQGYYPYSNTALKYSIGIEGIEQQIKSIEGNPDVYKKAN